MIPFTRGKPMSTPMFDSPEGDDAPFSDPSLASALDAIRTELDRTTPHQTPAAPDVWDVDDFCTHNNLPGGCWSWHCPNYDTRRVGREGDPV